MSSRTFGGRAVLRATRKGARSTRRGGTTRTVSARRGDGRSSGKTFGYAGWTFGGPPCRASSTTWPTGTVASRSRGTVSRRPFTDWTGWATRFKTRPTSRGCPTSSFSGGTGTRTNGSRCSRRGCTGRYGGGNGSSRRYGRRTPRRPSVPRHGCGNIAEKPSQTPVCRTGFVAKRTSSCGGCGAGCGTTAATRYT